MDRIGKYDLVRELGRGTTATVYLGRDPFAQRDVAIKLASPGILKDPERGRIYKHLFLNEASLVGKLAHPHIVQIFDAVVEDDLCYIVMEYVRGHTLERYCTPKQLLPVERAVEIVFKCTRALDFACRHGVTHRDIKPANILLSEEDPGSTQIKISDFGAALVESPEHTLVSGIGSPAYMSPEQLREHALDHRTDIYSLGIALYQLLTGQLPFQASSNYNIVYQIIHCQPPPPSSLRRGLPAELDAIVARAIDKDVEARYANWEEFANDLAAVFRKEPLKAPGPELAEPEKFESLRRMPFFARFSDVDIWEVIRFSDWQAIAAGAPALREGDLGEHFGFVVDGELAVSKNGRTLGLLASGDCFGEMAVIGRKLATRNADVTALTDARILTVRGEALQNASDVCRMRFYQSFLEVIAGRLNSANARLAAL